MTRDVDDVLRADLRELAAQVEVAPLDLPALRSHARGRVRRRRALLAAPLVCAALLAAVVFAVPRPQPGDTLMPAEAATGAAWEVTAQASVLSTMSGLQVRADPAPVAVSADHRTLLHLTWTNGGTGPVSLPYQGYAMEVRSADRIGVLGVTDGRCASWDDHGRRVDNSCPYSPDQLLQPGTSTTSDLVVADVVSTGSIAAGSYRFALPAGAVITLTVTGSRPPDPLAPVMVKGQVVADHGRGPVLVGRGPVPATLHFTGVRSGGTRVVVASDDGRFQVLLPPGSYQVNTEIRDGSCTGMGVDVAADSHPLEIDCKDGVSSF